MCQNGLKVLLRVTVRTKKRDASAISSGVAALTGRKRDARGESGTGPLWGESGTGEKAGQVRYWQYGQDGKKAGRVRYWQYGQAEKSPDLAISDPSRFPARGSGIAVSFEMLRTEAERVGLRCLARGASIQRYAFPRDMASGSPGHASRGILQRCRASAWSPRSSARTARFRRVRWP